MQASAKRRLVCDAAYKLTRHIAKDMDSYSSLIQPAKEQAVTRFDRDEIILGDLLGSGGFNNVFSLDEIDLLDENEMVFSKEQQVQRLCMAQRTNKTSKQYVVKLLKYDMIYDERNYCNGAADLIIETKILASLKPHPNIIRLYGMAEAGMNGFAEDAEGGYFLILDRLFDTLENRIVEWKHQVKKKKKTTPSTTSKRMQDNLKIAFELSSALKHLHKNNVIFRDLKPDNVGFDRDGHIKLFDFGLAKELNPNQLTSEGTYKMTGKTGSPRYMAPEVMLSKPYSLSADVYSYSLVIWEVFSLEEAFKGMTIHDHLARVVNGSHRPTIQYDAWPDMICKIMKCSWVQNPSKRPNMNHIFKAIKNSVGKEQSQSQEVINSQQQQDQNMLAQCKSLSRPILTTTAKGAASSKQSLFKTLPSSEHCYANAPATIKQTVLKNPFHNKARVLPHTYATANGTNLADVLEQATKVADTTVTGL